jgi:hypothetical protein
MDHRPAVHGRSCWMDNVFMGGRGGPSNTRTSIPSLGRPMPTAAKHKTALPRGSHSNQASLPSDVWLSNPKVGPTGGNGGRDGCGLTDYAAALTTFPVYQQKTRPLAP